MLSLFRSELFILILVKIANEIYGDCVQSYMTICHTFEDMNHAEDVEVWTDLIVQGDPLKANSEPFDWTDINFLKFKELETLVIDSRINNLKVHEDYESCSYKSSKLKYLSLYRNRIIYLQRRNRFPLINLDTLKLTNNQIEEIEKGTFKAFHIETFDVSDNFITTIQEGALPLTDATKNINMRNNKLVFIEPGSFPSSLITLHLDNNNLPSLDDDVLKDLVNIEELTLGHNKLNSIPSLEKLIKLKLLDVSSNSILRVDENKFKNFKMLELLDLSHNKISDENILHSVVDQTGLKYSERRTRLSFSLAFNRLKKIHYEANFIAQHLKLVLYGNPWNCSEWKQREGKLLPLESPCGIKYFTSGKTPYCINFQWNRSGSFSDVQMDKEIDRFHSIITSNSKLVDCDLKPKPYYSSFHKYYGCFKEDYHEILDYDELDFENELLQDRLTSYLID